MVILIVVMCSLFVCQGLILSKALKVQKDVEDESCRIALGNLGSEVITLRNEALEKDKILLSLVEKLKSSEARLSAQAEAHEADIQELKRKVAEATEKFNVEVVKHKISEIERSRAQKNVDELCAAKERCYEIAIECAKNLKNRFSKVGAFSSEQNFIRGNHDEVIRWINGEVKAFEEILSDRGTSVPLPVPMGLRPFWKRLVAIMLKL
jgi:predicted RNase H-like nuclease (RuvC/YqgF family)